MINVKELFISRFDNGVMLEADWSSLEVYTAAILANDKTLIHELRSGLDPHLENAAVAFSKNKQEVTKEERTHAKILSFQILYGAHYKSMAATFGLSEYFTKEFVENFYDKYNGIAEWHTQLKEEVRKTRRPTKMKTDLGYPAGQGHVSSFSGRRYYFREHDTTNFQRTRNGVYMRFNDSQIVNYPVQGGAFDIVSTGLAMLFKYVASHRDKYLLVNCIHDSYLFDCKEEYLNHLVNNIKKMEKNLAKQIKLSYNIDIPLELKIDIEVGENWANLKEIGEYLNASTERKSRAS